MRIALVIALLLPAIASAQQVFPPAQLTPPSPTAGDVIRATFTIPGLCFESEISTIVVGTVVRTTVEGSCIAIDPPLFDRAVVAEFGPLAPGTYTYEIYFAFDEQPPTLRSTQTFAVSPTPIPTLSAWSVILLAVVLAIAAMAAIGTRLS